MQFRDVENYTKPRLFLQVNLKNTIFQNKLFICGFKAKVEINQIVELPFGLAVIRKEGIELRNEINAHST